MEPIKAKYPAVSYADLYQMASAVAVEVGAEYAMIE
jgi:catalase (peroxidase I)